MLGFLTKLVPKSLGNRLFNKYTGHGSWLLLFVMAEQGIISKDAIKLLEGVPNIHVWIFVGLAFYLLLKAVNDGPEYLLEREKLNLEKEKVELEKLKTQVDIKKFKLDNKEHLNKE